MDGKGRCMDNVFVESASGGWRSIKYEEVYLKAYQNGTEARRGIGADFDSAQSFIWPSTTRNAPIRPWATGHRATCSKSKVQRVVYKNIQQPYHRGQGYPDATSGR
jgi:hypothetical protein